MPPTPMDILKMKVEAYQEGLDSKKPADKKGFVTIAFAEEFNQLLEEAKKVDPEMAKQLPEPIKFITSMGITTVQRIDYIHIEIKLRQIIGAIRLFE